MPPLVSVLVMVVMVGFGLGGDGEHWAIAVAVAALVVGGVGIHALRRGLPERPTFAPIELAALAAATELRIAELEAAGFERLGPALQSNLGSAPRLVPMVDRRRGLLAAVYEVPLPQPRAFVDLVSALAGGAMLTTASHVEAGVVPLPAERFLQIVPDAALATMLDWHARALAMLAAAGWRELPTGSIQADAFVQLVVLSLRQQRAAFVAAPLRTLGIALARALTRSSPHRRPLAQQLGGGGPGINGARAAGPLGP